MAQILNYVYVAAAVVFLFGAAVFVHEFGHYWMARRRGLKVDAFAIGFGPKILGWTRDGIEYSWRLIPAGGYVKLPQMATSEAIEGPNETSETIPPASPWSKILVAFSGPFMNAVFAFAIATFIYFAGLPVPVNPSIIGYVAPDSEEAKLGIRPGDQVVAVDGQPATTWQDVFSISALARTNVLAVTIEREGIARVYQLTTKTDNSLGLKMLNLDSQEHPVIGKVEPSRPAAAAGLKTGDKFVAFAGITIASHEQLMELINKRAGQPSEVVVERNGRRLSVTLTPIMDTQLKRGRIGIRFANTPLQYRLQKPGPLPWDSIAEVWNRTVATVNAIIHSKQTGVSAGDLSGPVGILAMLASQVNTDYRLALNFMVLLNVSLAILNLLPLPVLDGGHILISIIEAIRRRPMNIKVLEYTTTAFAVLLISFMLYVSFNDLKRWDLFASMFKRPTQIETTTPAPSPAPSQP